MRASLSRFPNRENVEMASRRASTMRRRGLATSQYAEATRNLNCDEAVGWCGVGWWSGANFYFWFLGSSRVTNFTQRQTLNPYSGAYTTMHPRQASSFAVVAT